MPPVTRYAKRGGVSVAYQVVGDGPFDVVFVPGFVSNLDFFWEVPTIARVWQRLASFSRLITFDKRGTGLSERTTGIPTLEERMDDLHAVMDAAGSERAALVGISEGGPMCLTFAATHPERTIALVLWGSYARVLRAPDYPIGIDEQVLEGALRWIERQWGTGRPASALMFSAAADDAATLDMVGRTERNSATPATALATLRFGTSCDVRDVLPAISVPTLVLHRRGDPFVSVEHGRHLAAHIPGARLVELPGDFHVGAGPDSNDALVAEIEEFLTGVRPERAHDADRVLATVLFTDIVGSTAKAAELGDRGWRALLDAHDAAVRAEIERARGHEVNRTGDGFVAAFDGPARAIHCAQAITAAARRLGLAVRTGLHTGECTVRDGELSGVALHIGARVAALAGAGEVLVTSTVRDLVLGSGFRFEDRGVQALRGVPGEWRVLALAAP
jgi:pimeloyl-ACP methyl ester carboxylesterase